MVRLTSTRAWRAAARRFRGLARRGSQPGSPQPPAPPGADPLPETVLVRVPSLDSQRASSFRMHTRSGSDQIARDLFRLGWHGFEWPVPDVLARCVAATDELVVDVGANTGFYCLLAASVSAGTVHAFEPFPVAVQCLRDNLELNQGLGERVQVFTAAVSDEVGETTLFVPDPGHGLIETSCSLNGQFKEHVVDHLPVRVVTLDAHLEAYGRPRVGVVKIDVESLEHRVLAGAARTLSEDRPLVFLEVLPSGDPPAIERLRRRHDYVAVRLRADCAVVGGPVTFDHKGWNQALVPSEKVAVLEEILARVPLAVVPAGLPG